MGLRCARGLGRSLILVAALGCGSSSESSAPDSGAPADGGSSDGPLPEAGALDAGGADASDAGRSTYDAGGDSAVSWSCVDAPGTLCFCDVGGGDDGGVPACSGTWPCCFVGPTSCECTEDTGSACAATIASSPGLTQVSACPPPQ
jgi:hypothetical protein